MFFDRWYDLFRVLVVGILAYAGLILFLRVSGKRTLAKMNAFDLVVTVALGSTLATILLSSEVSLLEGLLALGLLIGLQFIVARLQLRSRLFEKLVKSEPRMLFYQGEFLTDAMKRERVARVEILQAVRSQGNASLDAVEAVVLETDGTFAVITKQRAEPTALENVNRREQIRQNRD